MSNTNLKLAFFAQEKSRAKMLQIKFTSDFHRLTSDYTTIQIYSELGNVLQVVRCSVNHFLCEISIAQCIVAKLALVTIL